MSDAWRWMPISGLPSKASMRREMSYRISTRSQLLPATPRLQRHIFINRYRRTTKTTVTSWIMPPPKTILRGLNLQKRPCAGSACKSTGCFLNHRSITAVTCVNSAGRSGRPFPIPCHFARQPRQHVAVACCATNTGCPLKGVCLPSFAGFPAPSRFDMRSTASARTPWRPFLSRFRSSSARSRNRRRKGDFSRSRKAGRCPSWPSSVRAT